MKTRILSLVLAVIMVVSMAAVFSFSSSADETVAGLTVTVGNAYAVAGEDVKVQIYVSADSVPEGYAHLRNWQFVFGGEFAVSTDADATVPYVSGGSPYYFVNNTLNQVGNSSNSGFDCGTAAQILAKGGWCIGVVAFTVPAGTAAGEYALTIEEVEGLSFESEDTSTKYTVTTANKPGDYAAATVAGKVIVVDSITAGLDAYEGTGENYAIPAFNAAGSRVSTGLNEARDDLAVTGEFDTIVIPAAITDEIADMLDGFTFNKLVLKGTNLAVAGDVAKLGSSSAPVQVYIHKRANGANGTADAFDALSNLNKKKVSVHNILTAYEGNVIVDGSNVIFLAGIAVDDLDYVDLTLSADFGAKKLEKKVSSVYTTVNGVATVSEETAGSTGLTQVEGTYLTALKVTGVPSGTYNVTFTLYGTTEDADGCPIVVCSDPITVEVTV